LHKNQEEQKSKEEPMQIPEHGRLTSVACLPFPIYLLISVFHGFMPIKAKV